MQVVGIPDHKIAALLWACNSKSGNLRSQLTLNFIAEWSVSWALSPGRFRAQCFSELLTWLCSVLAADLRIGLRLLVLLNHLKNGPA